jgi:thiol-disulfide isomerase/thioredoxin
MRKSLIYLALAALCGTSCSFAQAQDPAQNASQAAAGSATPAPVSQQSQQQARFDSADQPVSLADMERAAQIKRQTDVKPTIKSVKLLDDDNMPRGIYAADSPPAKLAALDSQAQGSAPAGGPFPEYRGKVVLLDFWASWCGPCRNALPNLKRLQAVYGGGEFVVVSISEDDDEADWRTFVAGHNMTWPQRLDSDSSLQKQFGVNALPTYILLGRDGAVVRKFVGEEMAESIVERVGPDLKKTLAAKP